MYIPWIQQRARSLSPVREDDDGKKNQKYFEKRRYLAFPFYLNCFTLLNAVQLTVIKYRVIR